MQVLSFVLFDGWSVLQTGLIVNHFRDDLPNLECAYLLFTFNIYNSFFNQENHSGG